MFSVWLLFIFLDLFAGWLCFSSSDCLRRFLIGCLRFFHVLFALLPSRVYLRDFVLQVIILHLSVINLGLVLALRFVSVTSHCDLCYRRFLQYRLSPRDHCGLSPRVILPWSLLVIFHRASPLACGFVSRFFIVQFHSTFLYLLVLNVIACGLDLSLWLVLSVIAY